MPRRTNLIELISKLIATDFQNGLEITTDNLSLELFYIIAGCETKPPILEWDETADFENGTKWPILIMRQNRRF